MIYKKGAIPTRAVIVILVLAFVFALLFGLWTYSMNQINTALMSVEGMAGSVNFSNATAQTFGQYVTALNNTTNLIVVGVIFAMFLGMLINAFINRSENVRAFFIVDFIILLVTYIFSTYISNAYESIITVSELSNTFTNIMNQGSALILKLPLLVIIFGVLIMIISYSAIPKTKEEEVAGM